MDSKPEVRFLGPEEMIAALVAGVSRIYEVLAELTERIEALEEAQKQNVNGNYFH